MSESDLHSVTELLQRLEDGSSTATHQIWERFIQRLINAARRNLKDLPRRAVDEEDVAVSAFNALFRGVKEGRFQQLADRDDLWQLLAMLVERKAIAVLRRELADKRGGGLNRGESVFEKLIADSSAAIGIDQVAEPQPARLDSFTQEVRQMFEQLNDETLRRIALAKLEGYTNREIADQLGISVRAVERKLSLIRQKWDAMAEG